MKYRIASSGHFSRREFMRTAALSAAAAGASAGAVAQASKPNNRIGVGFIGVGGRSVSHLSSVNALVKQDGYNLEVAAVCDVYRPRAEHKKKEYGGTLYMDYRDLLADPNVDIVCIATPDHLHGQQAIDAVRAGKHVYCEKPVTHWRQFELTKELAAEVAKSGKVFQLGTQGMSDSAWRQIRRLVQDGLIGPPIHAECGYFRVGDWGERGMPIDDPNAVPGPDLDWEAFLGDSPKRGFDVSRFFRWRMYEDYAGGPVTDLYPHSLTPVVHMLGVGFPSHVVATGGMYRYEEREVPDTFNMIIEYPERISLAVLGTQGNNYQGTGEHGPSARTPILRGWEGAVTLAGEEIVFTPAEGSKRQPQTFRIEHKESTKLHWKNLIDKVAEGGVDTYSPVELALHVQTALQMGMRAFHEGRTIRFDPSARMITS